MIALSRRGRDAAVAGRAPLSAVEAVVVRRALVAPGADHAGPAHARASRGVAAFHAELVAAAGWWGIIGGRSGKEQHTHGNHSL